MDKYILITSTEGTSEAKANAYRDLGNRIVDQLKAKNKGALPLWLMPYAAELSRKGA